MLFIHGSLTLGGVETFFVRMAKERARQGKMTKMLLVRGKVHSNSDLLNEMNKYAQVFFLEDFVSLPRLIPRFVPFHLFLLLPLNCKKLSSIFDGIDQVHTSNSICAFFCVRLMALLNANIMLTVGVYHVKEFTWTQPGAPFYGRSDKRLFFELLNVKNLIFFNDRLIHGYEKYIGHSLAGVNIFPIGVVESVGDIFNCNQERAGQIIIGSVGRLVSFKTYNLWMIDVINGLRSNGLNVIYKIYGDGPLKDEMQRKVNFLGLQDYVHFQGHLEYSTLSQALSELDIFVGSGTAIVEAAALGVPGIVGIEAITEPLTYGFLSEIPGFTYHEDNLYPKVEVVKKITDYLQMGIDDVKLLKLAHIEKAKIFSMKACAENFEGINAIPLKIEIIHKYSRLGYRIRYSFSFFFRSAFLRLTGRSLSAVTYG